MMIPMFEVAQFVASLMQVQVPLWVCGVLFLVVSVALRFASNFVVMAFRLGLCISLGYFAWRYAAVRYALRLGLQALARVLLFALCELHKVPAAVLIHLGLFIAALAILRYTLALAKRPLPRF
jgi:hypothetical protein